MEHDPSGPLGKDPPCGQEAGCQSLEKIVSISFIPETGNIWWVRKCLHISALHFLSLHCKGSGFLKGDAPRCWGQKTQPQGGRLELNRR